MNMPGNLRDRELAKFREGPGGSTNIAVEVTRPIEITPPIGFQVSGTGESAGEPLEILSVIVPEGKTYLLEALKVSSHVTGTARLFVGTSLVGAARTAPGKPDAEHLFYGAVKALENSRVFVVFSPRQGAPASDVEAFLTLREV